MADASGASSEVNKESIADSAAQVSATNGEAQTTNGETKAAGDALSASAADIDAGEGSVAEVKAANGETTDVAVPDVEATEQAENTKPTPNKSRRKSSGGVPEHKSKKLNKKKSMPTLHLDLQPGDYVWARLKGHPAWPSIVCDEAMLPESLLAGRPVSARRPDGSYREDFLEGGKNVRDRKYAVMFLHTNEFAWMVNTALERLDREELEKDEGKKTATLKAAYELAAEGHDLSYFKDLLVKHDEELKEIEKEQIEREEQKAAKAAEKAAEKEKKKASETRRKSKAADDEMDIDDEGKPSKKRKKDVESDGEGKPKKTPKVKLTTKEPKPESAAKSKPKKKVTKPEEATPKLTEAERLDRREKAVFYIRHKLQRALLSGNGPPSDDEMPAMAEHFTQLEQYKDLEPQLIRLTKIHKVLKNIVRLDHIPRDEEFGFKKRSAEMLNHWNSVLASTADVETPVAESKPSTNGAPKTEEATNGVDAATEVSSTVNEEKKTSEATVDGDTAMTDVSAAEVKTDQPSEQATDGAANDTTATTESKQAEAVTA